MALPPDQQAVADELTALWREAQASIQQQLAVALQSPDRITQVARLRALATRAHQVRAELESATRTWLSVRLPVVHAAGAASAAAAVGSRFAWTMPHLEAIHALASTTWADVAANLRGLDATTTTAIRELTRSAAREALLEGATAAQAGRDLEAWMGRRGIAAVTYANGSRHLAGDYADTLARTVTANAYNTGTFTQAREDGHEWVEVFDGPACGWTSHDDPDKANGTIRRLADAENHPISHPRCARSFAPRPDITSQAEADAAARYDAGQQAVMAAEENLRAASAPTTLSGRPRAATKAARTTRVPRTTQMPRGVTQTATQAPTVPTTAPVSKAMKVAARSPSKAYAEDALAAIDSLHTDGVLPELAVNGNMGSSDALGFFSPARAQIAVSSTGPWPRLTATHEVGHALDAYGIPGAGYTSRTAHRVDNPMHGWWTAIQGTDAYKALAADAGTDPYVAYLFTPVELWARSYAQYVAVESGDAKLANELRVVLAYQAPPGSIPHQWDPKDFDPVRQAITQLIADLGWAL